MYFLQIFLHSVDALEFKASYHRVLFIQVNCYLEIFRRKYIYNFYIIWKTNSSSHQRCSTKKVFLKISQNSLENICTGISFSINLGLWHRSFPRNFPTFSRTPFVQNTSTSRQLPLDQSPAIVLCKKFTNFHTNLVCNRKYKMRFILRKNIFFKKKNMVYVFYYITSLSGNRNSK